MLFSDWADFSRLISNRAINKLNLHEQWNGAENDNYSFYESDFP